MADTARARPHVRDSNGSGRKARYAVIYAYWAYGDKRAVEAVQTILDEESSSADFVRVNEDLKRLLVHLERT